MQERFQSHCIGKLARLAVSPGRSSVTKEGKHEVFRDCVCIHEAVELALSVRLVIL